MSSQVALPDLETRWQALLATISAGRESVQVLDWARRFPRHGVFILLSGPLELADLAWVNMARRRGICVVLDLAFAPQPGDPKRQLHIEIAQAMRADVVLLCGENLPRSPGTDAALENADSVDGAAPRANRHLWADVIVPQLHRLLAYARANRPQVLERPYIGRGSFKTGFKVSRRAIAFSVSVPSPGLAEAEPDCASIDGLYETLHNTFECTRSPVRQHPPAVDCPQAAVIISLKQDLDLALPIMVAAQRLGVRIQAWLSCWVAAKSLRVAEILALAQLDFIVLPTKKPERWISKTQQKHLRHLLAITETNLPIHDFGRRLVKWANKAGVRTATMQHGLENIGLTYSDSEIPIDTVRFHSQKIYIWGEAHNLHPLASTITRQKCISVGYPKSTAAARRSIPTLDDLNHPGRLIIGIFENLHWSRYDDHYRKWFMDQLKRLASFMPGTYFLLKPHHAGIWTSSQGMTGAALPANVILADPLDPNWEPYTAEQLLAYTTAVITTPSTVALDAAAKSIPVAVAAGPMDLDFYKPLTLLREPQHWADFSNAVTKPEGSASLIEQSRLFFQKCAAPGRAADLIARDISAATHRS